MFGIDFSELMVIMVVALVVIGPERLPKVARTLGHLWGRAQRYINSVKADISRDMAIEEFRQLQQKVQQEASSIEQEFNSAEQAAKQLEQDVGQQVHELNSMLGQSAQDTAQHTAAISQQTSLSSQPVSGVAQQPQLEPNLTAEQKKFPVD
jgi:sec-independent protein translocase protein TatB